MSPLKKLSNWGLAVADRYIDTCLECGEFYKAKEYLQLNSVQDRSVKRWKQLAKVYDHFGEIKNAIDAYKHILKYSFQITNQYQRLQPSAIEATLALISYGCSQKELKVYDGHDPVVSKVGQAFFSMQSGLYSPAMDIFKSFLAGNNTQSFCFLAHAQQRAGDSEGAIHSFKKIRRLEPNWIDYMDHYGVLLQTEGNASLLLDLSNDLFALGTDRPEPWVVLSLLAHLKSSHDQALVHIDKALLVDNRHFLAHQVKGKMLFAIGKPGEAALSYRNAYRLCRDISNYEGLVNCYLTMGKQMEATSTAKEALALFPHSARAVSLAGKVMAENTLLRTKAREYLNKALKMDPNSIETLYALSDLYIKQGDTEQAINVLKQNLLVHFTFTIHVKLGQLYFTINDYSNATTHFNTALTSNPDCQEAKQGLLDIERAINGEDQDDLDIDSENEDESDQDIDL